MTIAMDVSIASAFLRRPSAAAFRLDQAALQHKEQKSSLICAKTGWIFSPLISDTYGAIRYDGPQFLSKLISCTAKLDPLADKARLETYVWRAVSTDAMALAAHQLAAQLPN
jgi:hypothetical protein